MSTFNLLCVFLIILAAIEETEEATPYPTLYPTDKPTTAHPILFFTTPLEDKIGVYQDQGKVTLGCNGGSKGGDIAGELTYRWFKNGKEILYDPRYKATIYGELIIPTSDYSKDNGNYQCMITDSTPEKWSLLSNTAELYLAFITGPHDKRDVTVSSQEWQPWQYVFTNYKHSRFPKPKYYWKFKGKSLKETERISISEDGNLYIAQLQEDDAGRYSFEIEITSTLKEKRKDVILQVSKRSRSGINDDILSVFMLGPKSRTVSLKREKEVTFECFASGKPMPKISWRRNGKVLSPSSKYEMKDYNKRLRIKDLSVSDSGTYQCAITRAAVKSIWDAVLTVVEPPEVVSLLPNNQIGHIGNYSALACRVTCADFNDLSQSWYRNGRKLSSRTSRVSMRWRWVTVNRRRAREYILNVTKLQKDPDGGMYQCFATNKGGEGMAYTAVDVQTLPPNITFGPGVVYAVKGKPAWIRCIATGSPPITFTWEKNGRPFTPPGTADNGKNGSLYIKSVQRSDEAHYTCIARNGPRVIDSHRASGLLDIVDAIVVVNKSSVVRIPKGSNANIYCGLLYDPKVNITFRWYLQGVLITKGRREIKSDGRLVIHGAYERDQGIYRCEANSSIGNYSTTVEVKVQAPPYVTTSPQVDELKPYSVRLRWKAGYHGNSPIKYFIIGLKFENGTEIIKEDQVTAGGDIKKYVVRALVPSTKYWFRIRAVNSVGKSPWSPYSKPAVTTEAAPTYKLKKVIGVAAINVHDTIDIEWEYPPTSTHNGILLGYYVAYKYSGLTSGRFTKIKVTPATTTKTQIKNLLLNAPYDVKVQMFNNAGPGPFSDPIVVKTREGIPSSAPRNLAVRNVSSRSVVLEWDPPPQLDWNGDLVSYNIRLWEFDKVVDGHAKDVKSRTAPHDPSAIFGQSFNVTRLKTYTQYVFKVSAQNSAGGGPSAGPISARTSEDVPSAPSSLSIVEAYSDTITVKWKRPQEVNGVLTGYIVKYWEVGYEHLAKTETVGGEAVTAGITSLKSKTEYWFDVAAQTKVGVSPSSRIRGKTLDAPIAPSAPSYLRFREVNATSLELDWKEGSKGRSPIISYIVEGNNETGFAHDKTSVWWDALILSEPFKLDVPPVNITGLRPNTVYRFRVTAINKVGRSPTSTFSPDQRTAEAAPSSPPTDIGFSSGNTNPGELWLKWRVPPKETWNSDTVRYVASFQAVDDDNEVINMTGIPAQLTRFRMTLKKYTKYEISMLTMNEHGESPTSPVIIGHTGEHVPDLPPRNIRAIGISGSSIRITWETVQPEQRNGRITGYKLFYALVEFDAVQEYSEIDVVNVTSYVLKNLRGYTHYDIRLLAYTKIGDGKKSERLIPYPRTLETKPGPPSELHFPTISASLVIVSWKEPAQTGGNITSYRVRYKPRDDATVAKDSIDLIEETYTVDHLSADKFYIFEVQAFTSVGWGPPATGEVYTSRQGNQGTPRVPLILPISDDDVTSRSIKVRWAVVTRRLHPIRFFTLQFKKVYGAWETQPKPLDGKDREIVVWGLDPGHSYSFRISSTIDAGESAFSKPSPPVRTLNRSPTGSPRDVRITSPSPTQLKIEWQPPSLVDIQSTVLFYRVGYRRHRSGPLGSSAQGYHRVTLPASKREHTFNGLREYTLYDIKLNAIDISSEELTSYTETRRTAARQPPRPNLKDPGNIGPTSVTLYWDRLSSETPILGYKAKYEDVSKRRRRRRRRAVSGLCLKPEPGAAYFSNTSTQGTITDLHMYTKYRIVLYAYNSAGDSPGSNSVSVKTAEGVPGPPATFGFDGVYGTEVHLYWSSPCEPNGRLRDYKLTVIGRGPNKVRELDNDVNEYKVKGLAMLTKYKFQLVATTSQGAGVPKVLSVTTSGPPVKPSPPTIVRLSVEYNKVTIAWRDGFHGNTPITRYIFQSRTSSERSPWAGEATFDASEVHKNRTDGSQGTKYVVLEDLNPNTVYWFRIIVENEIDRSDPSATSKSVVTGPVAPGKQSPPVYERVWFIAVMSVIGFIILLLLIICIVCLCCRRRRRKEPITHPAYELSLQHSNRMGDLSADDNYASNGGVKSTREDRPLVDESEEEEEDEEIEHDDDKEEQASSLETKSDPDETESEDDIPKKKREMRLRDQDDYYPRSKPHRSFSSDNVHGSPPPAYATFASRANARSEPFLEPFNDFDDEPNGPYKSAFNRPPTRRAVSEYAPYDYDSSDSSEIQRRKRGDPRSSSFRRALFSGKPEPEPERPFVDDTAPSTREKPTPRKYRSLEKAVNDSAKPPSYEHDDDDDDDIDVRIRQPGMSDRYSNPPDYRSDSGRDSYGEDEPAPAYQSSEGSSELERNRLGPGVPKPEPEISSYSSFV